MAVFFAILGFSASAEDNSASDPEVSESKPMAVTDQHTEDQNQNPEPPSPETLEPSVDTIEPSPADLALSDTLEDYLTAIDNQEAEGGAYNMSLSETYFSMGKTLQNVEQYEEAVLAYKRSMHVARVNDGIYSVNQAPMLRGIIESREAEKNFLEASMAYQQLYWVNLKTYGENDLKLIPLMDEISRWHLGIYAQTGKRADLYHLTASHSLYSSAINLVAEHFGPSNLQLIDLLKSLALTSYYFAAHQQQYPHREESGITFGTTQTEAPRLNRDELLLRNYYQNGRKAYERIISILYSNPDATPEDKAGAYAELGDWYLLFGRKSSAMQSYQKAHEMLAQSDQKAAIAKNLFGQPKMLPLIADQFSSPTPTERYARATLDITPHGSVQNVNILETYPADHTSLASRAKKSLRAGKFRPRFVDGSPVFVKTLAMKIYLPD